MLILRFSLGARSFAIRAAHVREILPVVRFRPVPLAPEIVAGDFLLRGVPCPVIDLRRWLDGEPARIDLATRLLLLDWTGHGATGPLAVIGERVRDAVEVDPGSISPPAIGRTEDQVIGGEVVIDGEIVTVVDPAALMTGELAELCYARAAG